MEGIEALSNYTLRQELQHVSTTAGWRIRAKLCGFARGFSFFRNGELGYPAVTGRGWVAKHGHSTPSRTCSGG